MSTSRRLYRKLRQCDCDFYVSVPCKNLTELIDLIRADPAVVHTPVTREEEGVGILAGAALAGKRPALLLQNSGLGNSINAICSLLNCFQIPVLFVVSHRGTPGEQYVAQFPMGEATASLLRDVGVRSAVIGHPTELGTVDALVAETRAAGCSLALLLPFSFWNVKEEPR